jgi:hypothetical protein
VIKERREKRDGIKQKEGSGKEEEGRERFKRYKTKGEGNSKQMWRKKERKEEGKEGRMGGGGSVSAELATSAALLQATKIGIVLLTTALQKKI